MIYSGEKDISLPLSTEILILIPSPAFSPISIMYCIPGIELHSGLISSAPKRVLI